MAKPRIQTWRTTRTSDDAGGGIMNKPLSNAPTGGFQYTPKFNDGGVAVNPGDITGRQAKEAQFTPKFGSETGKQAAKDLSKSLSYNDQAQTQRATGTLNSTQSLADSISRIQLLQQGRANAAKVYQDISSRGNDQLSLAAGLRSAQINNAASLNSALAAFRIKNGLPVNGSRRFGGNSRPTSPPRPAPRMIHYTINPVTRAPVRVR